MQNKKWLSNEDYDYIYDRVPRLCVDLVIQADEGILLSLRDIEPHKGLWHLPGGMVYKDELIEEAVKRIAKKETGLEVAIDKLLGYIEFPHEIQDGKDRHTVSIVFLLTPNSNDIKTDFQSSKIQPFSKLPENINTPHGKFLMDNNILVQ